MAKEYKIKLLRKEKLAKDTWLFAFEKPEGYHFSPGQYQTFTLSLPNGKKDWRDMTITSSPHHTELWLVTKIREESSLFKKILLNLSVGSPVQLKGPSGGFTIKHATKPLVFLAGGIGVNVFHSILTDAAEKNSEIPMTLLVSFSSPEDSIFFQELNELNKKLNHLTVVYSFERMTEQFLRHHVSSILDSIFMIAGPQEFVDSMNEVLLHMGVSQENIRIDYFTGY